jgi:hypothetical protein
VGIPNSTLSLLELSWLQCNPAELLWQQRASPHRAAPAAWYHAVLSHSTNTNMQLSNPSTICCSYNFGTCHYQLEIPHSTDSITFVRSQDNSVGVVTRLQAGCPRNCGSIPCTENSFLFPIVSRLALMPTHSPIPWAYWISLEAYTGQCNMPHCVNGCNGSHINKIAITALLQSPT